MTGHLGRRARWTATLVLSPAVAAVFGLALSWAAHTAAPQNSPTPVVKAIAQTRTPDTRVAVLRREAVADKDGVATLRDDLLGLQATLARMRAAADGVGPAGTLKTDADAAVAVPAATGVAAGLVPALTAPDALAQPTRRAQ